MPISKEQLQEMLDRIALGQKLKRQQDYERSQQPPGKPHELHAPPVLPAAPVVQKLQAKRKKPEDRKAHDLHPRRHQGADGAARKRYSLRVIFHRKDLRRRDGSGMYETVADALIR